MVNLLTRIADLKTYSNPVFTRFLKSSQVLHVLFSMHKNFPQNKVTWKVKMLQTSRLVIYRPVCKIQASHMTNLMTLKALSILYFYLYLDFEGFCDVFPGSVNFTFWSVNYLLDRCRIHEACWSVFMLCFVPVLRFQSKS